jgi:hypothetical protein
LWGGIENLWKYESTNKSNKVYTSTHHRISTNGFTIPVTSPDKSVVNFSRSCVILWSASIFLLDMWKTYKYIWHELKLLILDATNSTREIDISFNKWKTILKMCCHWVRKLQHVTCINKMFHSTLTAG